jgi:triacylglycerol esterase/lipase EstA (alpha/beta hydrolase family)
MRRTLALSASLVLAGVLGLVVASPAHAAPARANGQSNPVIFVHGWNSNGNTDCNSYWSAAKSKFSSTGWTGALVTFGYYTGDTNCSIKYNGSTTTTSIKTVGKALANEIYNRYSKNGVKVDVVAHSMGGLVIRSALTEVAKKTAGYPAYLYVEDVVTLSTPHGGATNASWCNITLWLQCQEMWARSTFLKGLADRPVSAMGTDWTAIASYDDPQVSYVSGVAMGAQHKIQYDAGLDHTEIRTVSASGLARYVHLPSTTWSAWGTRVGPVQWARNAAYNHSAT